jgi:hypothetical protein
MSKKSGGHGPWLLSAIQQARWPALKRFRTAPRVRSVMLNQFLRCHCRFVPALHFLITGPCKKDVDARDNSWIKSGGGMAVEEDSTTSERPYFLQPLGQPEVGR